MLFDGVRSADPPISSGSTPPIALSTVPNAARLATMPFSVVNVGIFVVPVRAAARRRAGARAPARRSGFAAAYAASLRVPLGVRFGAALLRLAPVRERLVGHEERLRASASRRPSSSRTIFVGAERLAVRLRGVLLVRAAEADVRPRDDHRRARRVGLRLGDRLRRSASRSFTSLMCSTCQPYASKRFAVSSVKVRSVLPSIVIWLSS